MAAVAVLWNLVPLGQGHLTLILSGVPAALCGDAGESVSGITVHGAEPLLCALGPNHRDRNAYSGRCPWKTREEASSRLSQSRRDRLVAALN